MEYITPKEAAEKWGISQRRVQLLCEQGRIRGAERLGRVWLVPGTAEKPKDERIKTGRYIKTRRETGMTEDAASMPLPEAQLCRPHIPLPPGNAVLRTRLLDKIAPPGKRLTFVHASAGYGKTTLLAQYARGRSNVLWLTLEEKDNDVLAFLQRLEKAAREICAKFNFHSTDFVPLAGKDAFIPATLSALLQAIGTQKLTVILDDTHLLTDEMVTALLTEWVKHCPQNLTLIMSSRHEVWSGLLRKKLEGEIAELTKADLRFNQEEARSFWGLFDEAAYRATEGWPLAMQSYRVARENNSGIYLPQLETDRDIYRYLMNEIFKKLPVEMQRFLLGTSMLTGLAAGMCDQLLDIKNSQFILESLVTRNLFTQRVSGSEYRYHKLFRAFLQQNDDGSGLETARKAMQYCYDRGDFDQAAYYAIFTGNAGALQDFMSANADRLFATGRYASLKGYFDYLEAHCTELTPRTLLAKGMYLSSRGSFFEADKALSAAMPRIGSEGSVLHIHAMIHQARILRNKVSFEESSRCLDSLLPLLEGKPMVVWYTAMIEKIYNLTMTTQLVASMELLRTMIEKCSTCGDLRVKAWFERYLTVVYCYMGDYKSALKAYERSLFIPEEEQLWLMRHCVGVYAAKAYQATGEEDKVLPLLEAELEKLNQLGLYEELSMFYLFYAEILLAVETQKIFRGDPPDCSAFNRYLDQAEEYATFNRSTKDYLVLVKLLKLCAMMQSKPEQTGRWIADILPLLEHAWPYFQTLAFCAVANALQYSGKDLAQAKQYYNQCIETGQRIGSHSYLLLACGGAAAIYQSEGDEATAIQYTRKFMELSQRFDHRFHFQRRPLFAPILKLAVEHGITPEFTREMLAYGGYKTQRVYINTLGSFYIAPVHDRKKPVKIRTKKARELLAYLLENRSGVTRDQIFADLWEHSDANVSNLFHTRRGELKSAFLSLGAANPVLFENGSYRLGMEEVFCDIDAFDQAAAGFEQKPTQANAQKVVELYSGRYLNDLEALWAESTRLRCEEIFIGAAELLLDSYTKAGEKAKVVKLLRQCAGLSHKE